MPTRVWFPLQRELKKADGNGDKIYTGFFSCLDHVAKFLEIDDKAASKGMITVEREYSSKRAGTRVDNSTKQANDTSTKRKVQVILRRKVGKKRAIIRTRKVIADTKVANEKAKKSATHEISFAFPNWATAMTISDALAEIIPDKKISSDSSNKDTIPPIFRIGNGGTYGIVSKEEAAKRKGATTSEKEIEQKLQSEGGDVVQDNG